MVRKRITVRISNRKRKKICYDLGLGYAMASIVDEIKIVRHTKREKN